MAGTKKKQSNVDRNAFTMRVVASETCEVCKQQCARGIQYMEKMRKPGTIGFGVPCILTRGKPGTVK